MKNTSKEKATVVETTLKPFVKLVAVVQKGNTVKQKLFDCDTVKQNPVLKRA